MPKLPSEDEISSSGSPEPFMTDIPSTSNHKSAVKAADQLQDDLKADVESTPTKTTAKNKSSKKQRKQEAKPVEVVKEEDDDDGEEDDSDNDPDKFEVEAIRSHKYYKGNPIYEVKWKGYPEAENTWEPEANLMPDAREIVGNYLALHGGALQAPRNASAKRAKSKSSLRQTSSAADDSTPAAENHADSETPLPKRPKRGHNTTSSPAAFHDDGKWMPKQAEWDPLIDKIDTVERDSNGNLFAFILWKNKKKTRVGRSLYAKHCPKSMLDFYEAHLNFKLSEQDPDQD